MRSEPRLGQHANGEPRVPLVIVAHNVLYRRAPVAINDCLRPNILQLHILEVHPHQDAKMQRAQIDIGFVLLPAFLRQGTLRHQQRRQGH